MKRADRPQIKDTAIPTHPGFRKANVRTDAEFAARKIPGKGLKGPSTKYGQHTDVKEQNRLLVATNEDLQRQISEIKEYVAGLEQQCSDVQKENIETKEKLRDCHALLMAEKLDPVSGRRIDGTAEEKESQRKELMEVQNTMRSLKEAREKLCVNRESFSVDAEEMEKVLGEAERLLLE
ncbi:small kinetochore-associated protein isoform X3 [Astyanax mexicanus]|uniref:small kinetochore-associated protein isoform X3 n=1 Tax=Astyanax mexicanus TaxID=7994 RepID=UPI0020CB4114|nr:small kinetochore-associated protein isoform X3 [Astyanax mexicanus]